MNLLTTDGHKFSMAEAGWPLRVETFYYAHRKGGASIVPFDVKAELEKLMPEPPPAGRTSHGTLSSSRDARGSFNRPY